jgi:hypothetical protein
MIIKNAIDLADDVKNRGASFSIKENEYSSRTTYVRGIIFKYD